MIGPPVAIVLQEVATPAVTSVANSSPACDQSHIRYYPLKAQRANVEGSAVLECKVLASGALTACTVVSEDPKGYDFGDTALHMSCLFKMKPSDPSITPPEGRTVRVPLHFKVPSR